MSKAHPEKNLKKIQTLTSTLLDLTKLESLAKETHDHAKSLAIIFEDRDLLKAKEHTEDVINYLEDVRTHMNSQIDKLRKPIPKKKVIGEYE